MYPRMGTLDKRLSSQRTDSAMNEFEDADWQAARERAEKIVSDAGGIDALTEAVLAKYKQETNRDAAKAAARVEASDIIQAIREMIEQEHVAEHVHDWQINGVEAPDTKQIHPMLKGTVITRVLFQCKECHWLEVSELEGNWTAEQVRGSYAASYKATD